MFNSIEVKTLTEDIIKGANVRNIISKRSSLMQEAVSKDAMNIAPEIVNKILKDFPGSKVDDTIKSRNDYGRGFGQVIKLNDDVVVDVYVFSDFSGDGVILRPAGSGHYSFEYRIGSVNKSTLSKVSREIRNNSDSVRDKYKGAQDLSAITEPLFEKAKDFFKKLGGEDDWVTDSYGSYKFRIPELIKALGSDKSYNMPSCSASWGKDGRLKVSFEIPTISGIDTYMSNHNISGDSWKFLAVDGEDVRTEQQLNSFLSEIKKNLEKFKKEVVPELVEIIKDKKAEAERQHNEYLNKEKQRIQAKGKEIDIESLPFDLEGMIWKAAEKKKRIRKVYDADFNLYQDGDLEFNLYYDWDHANFQGGGEDDVQVWGTVHVDPVDIESENAWKKAINAQYKDWDVQVGP